MMFPIVILFLMPTELLCFVPESEFFSSGHSEGDFLLFPNDDQHSAVQNISIVFKFFHEHHSKLFVNTNGLISFQKGISTYTSETFPKIGERIVLAPFWTDIDTRNCGSSCNVWYRESTKSTDVVKATSEVRNYFPIMKNFGAKWTYIVTWENVPFYGASIVGINKRNTFQCILISDTESTFVIYNYNRIEWTTGTASGGNADTGIGGTPAQGSQEIFLILFIFLNGGLCLPGRKGWRRLVYTTPGSYLQINISDSEQSIECKFNATDINSESEVVDTLGKYQFITSETTTMNFQTPQQLGSFYLTLTDYQTRKLIGNDTLLTTDDDIYRMDGSTIDLTFTFNVSLWSKEYEHPSVDNYYQFQLRIINASSKDLGNYTCSVNVPIEFRVARK
ncbi:Hypothetical predicted protein [Mytilus galloprovincialis]|uniref:NIDO domain-containing protein n=1 Tax=Mytilus galloprovincialis TaxID=29158 RepID=A0A8B6BQX4_MYTGA|nr:Hypothetical predicted protein [Mytilus galloprovincialis]